MAKPKNIPGPHAQALLHVRCGSGSQSGHQQKWSWINLRFWVLVRIGVGEALVGVKVADLSHGFGYHRFLATS